jgi:hypothetical protein
MTKEIGIYTKCPICRKPLSFYVCGIMCEDGDKFDPHSKIMWEMMDDTDRGMFSDEYRAMSKKQRAETGKKSTDEYAASQLKIENSYFIRCEYCQNYVAHYIVSE